MDAAGVCLATTTTTVTATVTVTTMKMAVSKRDQEMLSLPDHGYLYHTNIIYMPQSDRGDYRVSI